MKPGTYLIRHNLLNIQYKLVVSKKGEYALYSHGDHAGEVFIKNTTKEILEKHCTTVKILHTETVMYDIAWYVGGRLRETIRMHSHYAICKAKIEALRKSTHTTGKLLPIRSIQ